MIEGLRLLPWWQEAIRRDLLGPKSSCETCMQSLSQEQRQLAACPLAPAIDESRAGYARAWCGLGYTDTAPTVCPGYTTSLPETIEVARAYLHWNKGALGQYCDRASEGLLTGIEVLCGSANDRDAWRMKPREKGGGAE